MWVDVIEIVVVTSKDLAERLPEIPRRIAGNFGNNRRQTFVVAAHPQRHIATIHHSVVRTADSRQVVFGHRWQRSDAVTTFQPRQIEPQFMQFVERRFYTPRDNLNVPSLARGRCQ